MLESPARTYARVWAAAQTPVTFAQEASRAFGSGAGSLLALYPHASDDEAKASADYRPPFMSLRMDRRFPTPSTTYKRSNGVGMPWIANSRM